MKRAVWTAGPIPSPKGDRCWWIARADKKRVLGAHVSLGKPVWWKPSRRHLKYNDVSEWGFGWLLLSIQFVIKREQ